MRERIAYVCADPGVPVFGSKGCSVHVQEMLRAFRRRGAHVELLAMKRGGPVPDDLADLPVRELPRPRGRGIERERQCEGVNALLAHELRLRGPFDFVYERHALWSFGAMESAADDRTPGLLEINAPLVEEQAAHRQLFDRAAAERGRRRAFRAASALLPVSRDLAERLPLHANERARCHVVPNGVDPARFALPLENGVEPRPFTVGFVGTLRPWHGVGDLAEGFALLRRASPSAQLLIVGDGPLRSLIEDRLETLGVRDAARFTGAVPVSEVPGWLRKMDAVVAPYPADADSYFSPLKLLEYLAAGRAVVASRTGPVSEWIEHGRNGLLHAPGDTREMARGLSRLEGDPQLRRRLGGAARASVEREHSWDAIAERLVALARQLRESRLISGVA